MKSITWYNIGEDPFQLANIISEIYFLIDIKDITIFTRHPKKTNLIFANSYDKWDDYIKLEEVPGDIELVRYTLDRGHGVLIISKNSFIMLIVFPPHLISTKNIEYKYQKAINAQIMKVMRRKGLKIRNSLENCDFFVDGTRRKVGASGIFVRDRYGCSETLLTKKFENYDLANKIYKFNSEKFKKKGEFSDLKDLIVGFNEYIPEEKLTNLDREIVTEIAKRFDREIIEKSFSSTQLETFKEYAKKFDNNWIINGKQK